MSCRFRERAAGLELAASNKLLYPRVAALIAGGADLLEDSRRGELRRQRVRRIASKGASLTGRLGRRPGSGSRPVSASGTSWPAATQP